MIGKLPEDISNLKKLQVLSVFDNNFFGTIPASIGDLANLEELVLSNNAFYGDLPTEMANLTNLKVLILGNNAFETNFTSSKTKLPPSLQQFDFNNVNSKGSIATLDTED